MLFSSHLGYISEQRGRGNALVALARLLSVAWEVSHGETSLVSYTGGTGPSAICREAEATVCFMNGQLFT